jgi:hypothetical protein
MQPHRERYGPDCIQTSGALDGFRLLCELERDYVLPRGYRSEGRDIATTEAATYVLGDGFDLIGGRVVRRAPCSTRTAKIGSWPTHKCAPISPVLLYLSSLSSWKQRWC